MARFFVIVAALAVNPAIGKAEGAGGWNSADPPATEPPIGTEDSSSAATAETRPPVVTIVGRPSPDPLAAQEPAAFVDVLRRPYQPSQASVLRAAEFSPAARSRGYGGLGALETLSLRGADPSGTLILIDGLAWRDPLAGAVNAAVIPAPTVERLRIMRGGGSHLYGSNAVGGIVDLDTIPDADRRRGYVRGGSFSTVDLGVELAHTDTAWLSARAARSEGDYAIADDSRRTNNGARLMSGAAGWWLPATGRSRLNLRVQGADLTKRTPGSLGTPTPLGEQRDTNARAVGDWSLGWAGGGVRAQAAWDYARLEFADDVFVPLDQPSRGAFDGATVQLVANQIFDRDTELNGIIETGWERARVGGQQTRARWAAGLGLQQPLGDLGLSLAARADGLQGRTAQILPSAGAWWRPARLLNLRAQVHRSFRDPTFNELYWPASAYAAGNADLAPESAWGGDGGLEILTDMFGGSIVGYVELVRDLIVWRPVGTQWQPTNVGEAALRGIELALHSAEYQPVRMRLAAAYSRAANRDRAAVRDTEISRARREVLGKAPSCPLDSGAPQLPYRALWGGTARVEAETGPVTWGASLRHMGRRAVDITNGDCLPPVWLVGADVRVAVGGHVEFVLSGENLGDVRYEEYAGYPAPSRAFFLTAEFDFLPATPVLHGPPM